MAYYNNPYQQIMPQMYQQPMQQLYSPPPQPQMPVLSGRVINNENDIKPNEIPMDGSISIFPSSDYSCIYAKKWGSDGKIYSSKFVLEKDISDTNKDPILERLDRIEKMLSRSPKNYIHRKEVNKHEQS